MYNENNNQPDQTTQPSGTPIRETRGIDPDEVIRQNEEEARRIRDHLGRMKQWADLYRSLGLAPIIIEPNEKMPRRKDWQREKGTAEEFENNYRPFCNLGINLGEAGNNLIDIDLDHPDALRWAERFLPDTPWKAGRPSNPRSHWFYRKKPGSEPLGTKRLRDPDKQPDGTVGVMVVEQRWTGTQTVVCPSVHPTGEMYEWDSKDWSTQQPTQIDPNGLQGCVKRLYAAVLMDAIWQKGQRYVVSVPFVKAMLDRRVPQDSLRQFMETLDEGGTTDWKYQIGHTLARIAQGEPCQGARTLIQEYGMTINKINKIAWALGGEAENEEMDRTEKTIEGILQDLQNWNKVRQKPCSPTFWYSLFQPGEVSLISGPSNSFKTQWALWHGAHFGLGELPYCDREELLDAMVPKDLQPFLRYALPPKGRSFCLFISPDSRQQDISNSMDRLFNTEFPYLGAWRPDDLGTVPHFNPVSRSERDVERFEPFKLSHPDAVQNNIELINQVKKRVFPQDPTQAVGLVIYDTLARMGGVDDELNNSSLTRMVETAEKIATGGNVAVVIIHHVSQGEHGRDFKNMDPRIFGRGGTATAAAARMAAGMMKVENTDGRVVGMKLAANNMPPRDKGLFWEICREGESGCHYFKPLTAAEVEAIQEGVKQETKSREPSARDLLDALRAKGTTQATKAELDMVVASLWPTQKGKPRKPGGSVVVSLATKLLEELEMVGSAGMTKGPSGPKGGPPPQIWVFRFDEQSASDAS